MKLLNLTLLIGGLFFGSFVFMQVWNWLPSEIFDFKKITYAEGFALHLFTTFFKNNHDKNEEEDDERVMRQAVMSYYFYGFIFFIAWIVRNFI